MFTILAPSSAPRVLLLGSLAAWASSARIGLGEIYASEANNDMVAATDEGQTKPTLGRSNSMGGGRPIFGRSNSAGDWLKPSEGSRPFQAGFGKLNISVPENRLQVKRCRGHAFDIVGGDGAQAWLSQKLRTWKATVKSSLGDGDPPEVVAAKALLKKDSSSRGLYWASLSNATGAGPRVEALAKVVKEGNRFGIPLIISRRALFGGDQGIGGAGKALIGGLTELFSEEADEDKEDLRIGGTPGDKFVAQLYHAHGAEKINASEDPDGVLTFGTLEFLVPQGCGNFFARAVCSASTWGDYSKFAARALQHHDEGSHFHPIKTCADMFPRQFVWDRVRSMFR
jgi:hypothetical protein